MYWIGDYMKKYNKLIIISLGVLAGIATYGVINAINTSKDKAEDAFLNEIGKQIEMYIDLNSFAKSGEGIPFKKVISNTNNGTSGSLYTRDVTAWEFKENGARLTIEKLLNAGLSDKGKITNPNDKELTCNTNNEIIIFRDTDSVYYYYVDFNDDGSNKNDCIINGKIINTLPKELICQISDLKEKYNAAPNIDDEDKCTE